MADLKLKRLDNVPAYLSHRAIVAVGSADDYLLYIGNNSNQPVPFNSPVPEVVETLPEPDAEKAGQRFILNGTEWVYNYELNGVKRFSGLNVGSPWPVKGYKEYSAKISQSGTNAPVASNVHVNEIGTVTLTRLKEGVYTISNQFIRSTDSVFISSWLKSTQQVTANVENGNVEVETSSFDGDVKDGIFIYIQIKLYP